MSRLTEKNIYNTVDLCSLFGKTRQAYYKQIKHNPKKEIDEVFILNQVKKYRKNLPKACGRKLFIRFQREHSEKVNFGRDAFFDILRKNKLLVKQKKKRIVTTVTYAWHQKYDNLIKELNVVRPNQVWVSDITCIRFADKFCYLSLITDLYTRKIMGYKVSPTLHAEHSIEALNMAIKTAGRNLIPGLIHHSDRGCQYCCKDYIKSLIKINAISSMSAKGNPYENAVAERVNGILKNEWLDDYNFKTYEEVQNMVSRIEKIYNSERLHQNLKFNTPNYVYKNYYDEMKIVANEVNYVKPINTVN